jgi:quercetin dioxygenase-like cupin family protein
MTEHAQLLAQAVNGEDIAWSAHPCFSAILMKQMLTSAANPRASVSRVRVPPGGVIGWHHHATQTERAYVLEGQSTLTLDEIPLPFGAGCIVAIPAYTRHTLIIDGAEPVEVLCSFTPPNA